MVKEFENIPRYAEMIFRIKSLLKQRVLGFTDKFLIWLGLLPFFVSITCRWGIKMKRDYQLSFPFVARRNDYRCLILCYHRVNDNQNSFFNGVQANVFSKQMEVLSKYFKVLPLDNLVEQVLRNDVPPNAVAITFDDGYRDNYENAFPDLKRFGLPATIFLSTGAIDSKHTLWHDRVFDAFQRTNAKFISINRKEYPLGSRVERFAALNEFRRYLRAFNYCDWDSLIEQLIVRLDVTPDQFPANAEKLNWKEIEEMSRHNITFGAHTVTHPILTRLPLSEAVDEIITSKETIEAKLRFPIRLFAYPNGGREDFNENIKKVLKEAGFLCAVSSLWGANDIQTDPFELRRVGGRNLDARAFALRLGWYRFSS